MTIEVNGVRYCCMINDDCGNMLTEEQLDALASGDLRKAYELIPGFKYICDSIHVDFDKDEIVIVANGYAR